MTLTGSDSKQAHGHIQPNIRRGAFKLEIGLLGLLVAALAQIARAEDCQVPLWHDLTPPKSPGTSSAVKSCFDADRAETILFGGQGCENNTIATWAWDDSGWRCVTEVGPPPRGPGAMAYDAKRKVVVLYGGYHYGTDTYYEDTWEWDGRTWTQASDLGVGESYANMFYDSEHARILMYVSNRQQMWEWSGTGWSMISNSGPPARFGAGLAYDSFRHRAILFGGSADEEDLLNDTWEWDGNAWALVATNGPSPRRSVGMCFDSDRDVTVLFGGDAPGRQDTWEWDGTKWTAISVNGPLERLIFDMVYDSVQRKSVVIGGSYYDGDVYRRHGDVWEWDGQTWVLRYNIGPQQRSYSSAVSSGRDGRVVMFGGDGTIDFCDTWSWDGRIWRQLAILGPSGRYGHAMAYDSRRDRIMLYGGITGNRETWEWNGSDWERLSQSSAPGSRYFHQMAYDSWRGVSVLFGGYNSSARDTWEWDGTTWDQAATTGPPGRQDFGMAFDPARGVTVLFGGRNRDGDRYGDTWEWSGVSWLQVASTGPSARWGHGMTYDIQRQCIILFDGYNGQQLRDLWSWDGSDWTLVADDAPVDGFFAPVVYDAQRNVLVVAATDRRGEVWEWKEEQDCNCNGIPDQQDIQEGTSRDVNTNGVPDECEPCLHVRRVEASCEPRNHRYRIKATLAANLPDGLALTLALDGEQSRSVILNSVGKAKATWRTRAAGAHEVCIVECEGEPFCDATICE